MKKRKAVKTPEKPQAIPVPAPTAVSTKMAVAISLSLAVITLAVYVQTLGYGFVYYDDNGYVYQNPMLSAGISAKGLSWALTTFYLSYWHPLTWMTYLLNYQLFGLNPGAEHVMNVIFHVGSVVVLFFALLAMTGMPWRCAMVAGIFALHPLHVESVAWISERKDVLSTFFEMLTLLLYARYAAKPSIRSYTPMALAFALSLMSKPMAVSLPFVLLLLDVWPLRRLEIKRVIWEKMPMFAMSAAASVVTFLAQKSNGVVSSLDVVPVGQRLANAAVGYVTYLGKAFWPTDLAVLYPLAKPSSDAAFWSLLLLIAITAAALVTFRRRPYFLVGWLWYLGMLVPVIGLVQVGRQSMADRYTYVPLVGFSIALVWMVADAVEGSRVLRQAAAAVGALVLIAMPVAAYHQAGYWKNSEILFRHTLAVTRDNPIVFNLGSVLQQDGRIDEAEGYYRQALALDPNYAPAETNLGVILAGRGKREEAIQLYLKAIAADPGYPDSHANLGRERLRAGQMAEATKELMEALRISPNSPEPQEDMGLVLAAGGDFEGSRQHLETAARLQPTNAEVQSNFCYVLQRLNRLDQATAACQAALKLKPGSPDARFNLGNVLAANGKKEEAAAEFSRVLAANPTYAPARDALDALRRK